MKDGVITIDRGRITALIERRFYEHQTGGRKPPVLLLGRQIRGGNLAHQSGDRARARFRDSDTTRFENMGGQEKTGQREGVLNVVEIKWRAFG